MHKRFCKGLPAENWGCHLQNQEILRTFGAPFGKMQEWLNWPAWKASKPLKGFRGSNPLLSAKRKMQKKRAVTRLQPFLFFQDESNLFEIVLKTKSQPPNGGFLLHSPSCRDAAGRQGKDERSEVNSQRTRSEASQSQPPRSESISGTTSAAPAIPFSILQPGYSAITGVVY